MDDEIEETGTLTAGERLRAAREEKGLTLEEVASETRIPRRHLESLETGDWSRLPAPTYTIGFAKSYAGAVGADRAAIGEQLRSEMGGTRPEIAPTQEVFQPADPARSVPRWLVIAAIAGIVLLVLIFSFVRNQSMDDGEVPIETIAEQPEQPVATPQPQVQRTPANGPVILTAAEPVWIQVADQGQTLFQGMLNQGQTYQVPATATAPRLRAGKPEALRVTVGGQPAPQVGPPGRVATNVSLLGRDLLQQQQQPGAMQQQQQNGVTAPAAQPAG